MPPSLNESRPVNHRRLAPAVALGIQAAGLVVLWLWHLGHWQWLALGEDYYPIAPLTALLFITLGMAWLASLGNSPRRRSGSRALSGFTVLVALTQTTADLVGYRLDWPAWLALPDDHFGAIPVGLTATTTMICMAFSAMATWALTFDRPNRWIVTAGSVASGSIAGVMALSYAFGRGVPQDAPYVPMALLTAALFITLNVAILGSTWSLRRSLGSPKTAAPRRGLWIAAAVIAPFILLLGVHFIHQERSTALRTASANLSTIAKLKARQISDWRHERTSEALFLQSNPHIANSLKTFIAEPDQPIRVAEVNQWLNAIRGNQRYAAASIYRSDGTLLHLLGDASLIDSGPGLAQPDREGAPEAALLSNIKIASNGVAILDVVVPIALSPSADSPEPAPLVVLTIKLPDLLYPALAEWPLPTTSGEIYLLTRQDDRISYASPLQRSAAPAILDAVRDTSEIEGLSPLVTEPRIQETHDYAGLPVLSALIPVPGSEWVLVVKMDQTEIFAPLGRRVLQISTLVFVLLLAVILAMAYLWQYGETLHASRTLAAERERHALATKLGLVLDHAKDGILLLDSDQRIVEANKAASLLYDRSTAELRQLIVFELLSAAEQQRDVEHFTAALQPEGIVFEAEHRDRGGRVFPVEVSARPVQIEGKFHVLAIIRDISDRKSREREIARFGRMYEVISNINQAIVRSTDREALGQDICDILVDIGTFQMAWIGWHDPRTDAIDTACHAGDKNGYLQNLRVSALVSSPGGTGPAAIAFRQDHAYVCNDFLSDPVTRMWHARAREAGIRSSIAMPLHHAGQPAGVLSVYAAEKDFFGPREIELLVKAAEDLDFAIAVLARDQQRRRAEQALSSSEMRLKTLLNSSPAVIYAFCPGEAARTTYLSPNVQAVLGHSPDAFLQNPLFWLEYVHPDDLAQAFAPLTKDATAPSRIIRSYRFRHADGSYRWLHDEIRALLDEDGNVLEYVGFFIDVTRHHSAEEQLRKLSRAIDQAPVSIAITDLNGSIEYVNPHFAHVTGYTAEELQGQNPRLLKSGQTPEVVYEDMWTTLLRGETWSGELRNQRKNGEIFDELAVISPVVDEHGRTSHYVAIKDDITDRKLAEVALWQSLDRLARAERIARLGNWELDHHTGTMLCSEEFFHIYEIPQQSLTQDSEVIRERIHPDDRNRFEIEIREAFAARQRFRLRHRLRFPDDRIKHVEVSGESRHEPGEHTAFTIGTIQDISDQVQTEVELSDVVRIVRVHLRVSQLASAGFLLESDTLQEIASLMTSATTAPARTHVSITVREREIQAGTTGTFADSLTEPIIVSGNVIGQITLRYSDTATLLVFKPEEQEFTASVARMIGLAIAENEALENLRTSEERFRSIFDHAAVGMFETAPDGVITRVNPYHCALLDQPAAAIIGRPWTAFCADDAPASLPLETPAELRFKRGSGATFYGLLKARPETRADGVVEGYICILHDVSDQVAARATMQRFNAELENQVTERTAALEASNREVQAILSAVPDTLLRMREDGTIVFQHRSKVTPTLAQLLDQTGSFSPFADTNHLAHRIMAAGKDALTNASTAIVETEVVTAEGPRTLELRTAPVAAQEFVVLLRDITDRKRDELETLNSLEQERQLSEMKSRFISVTSHEFRTPMAAALGSLDLLANHYDRLTNEKREQLFDRIKTSFQRMTEMLDDVLTLNRVDSGRTHVSLEAIDLCSLIRGLIDENQLADRHQHVFEFHPDAEVMKFVTDPNLLLHILSNILSNATRYSPAGSHVAVSCENTSDGVLLQVRDHGIGIPPDDLERIFSPFERGSNVGTIKGTGLGLNIVKRMTELIGGQIAVTCPPDGGSCFQLRLPSSSPP